MSVSVKFFRNTAGEPMLGLGGTPIPLHPDVTDELGHSLVDLVNINLDEAERQGGKDRAEMIRRALGIRADHLGVMHLD